MKNRMIALSIILTSLALTACGEASAAFSIADSNGSTDTTVILTDNSSEQTETAATDHNTTASSESTASSTTTGTTSTSAELEKNGITVQTITEAIGKQIAITNISPMAASMIGAEDGISFKVNDNKFEIYRFDAGHDALKQAKSGSVTLNVSGFGEMAMNCTANGEYIMIYSNPDDAVIEAFKSVETK